MEMKLISLHINHLMRTHDCVVVPGIGAFLAFRRPARFDAGTLTIYPAVREICFNASITHNDGVLAASVARREGIDYSEAVRIIEEEAAEMKRTLLGSPVKVGDLGTLSSTPEGHLRFSPRSPEADERSLGFAPVALRTVMEKPVEMPEEPEYIVRKRGYWYLPIPKTATKVAASLLLMAAVAISFLLPRDAGKPVPDKASVVPVCPVGIPVKKTETVKNVVEEEPQQPQIQPQPKAYLIVATFRSEDQARRYIESSGDTGLELVPGGSVFRVSAAKAETAVELRSTLNSREFQTRFPEAWIWVAPQTR